MRKQLLLLIGLTVCFMVIMAGCGSSDGSNVKIDYGTSELYTQEDMDAAIKVIEDEFSTWEGCELKNIRYTSDDANNDDNIAWLNSIAEGKELSGNYTQCIEFLSDFHSPVEPAADSAWEADTDYTDWQWYLARTDGGSWELVTNGY